MRNCWGGKGGRSKREDKCCHVNRLLASFFTVRARDLKRLQFTKLLILHCRTVVPDAEPLCWLTFFFGRENRWRKVTNCLQAHTSRRGNSNCYRSLSCRSLPDVPEHFKLCKPFWILSISSKKQSSQLRKLCIFKDQEYSRETSGCEMT